MARLRPPFSWSVTVRHETAPFVPAEAGSSFSGKAWAPLPRERAETRALERSLRPERGLDRLQCGIGFRAVGSAGLGHVGPPAAALAAQRLGALANEIDRVEAPSEIRRDADHDASLALFGDADDGDNAGTDL